MKKPFQVGERVAFYFNSRRVGMIVRVTDECVHVNDGINTYDYEVHPKQCRRLIPKKRREIYMNEYSDGIRETYFTSKGQADSNAYSNRIRCVRFVEVLEKKEET